jgi:GlpG protein
MRQIGNISDETHARVFGDFLLANGIHNEVEREADGSWSVWVVEEDRINAAQTWLEQFRTNPEAAQFREAQAGAAKVREAEAQDLANYRKRIRTRRSLFPKFGGYGIGVLTYALIFACVVVAAYTKLGKNPDVMRQLFISDPLRGGTDFLPEVFAGEVWRLFTPILAHDGILHLVFNMAWLFQLGCMIEARRSTWLLAALVLLIALVSNIAQLVVSHNPAFCGMSGVVYGLAGYVWVRGRYDPKSGLFLDQQSMFILLAWMVFCYTGILRIANTAHTVGLITGVVWGGIAALLSSRKPE